MLLQAMGDLMGAHPYLERALAIFEEVFGPTHHHTATSLNNLGVLCYHEGDLQATVNYLQRAFDICLEKLGPDHPDTQSTRSSLEKVRSQMASG